MFHHRIQNDDQLAHACRECDFLCFSGLAEALVEGTRDEKGDRLIFSIVGS